MQLESGREFLAGISLRGDETAIDAGCGTGRVTRLLAERLPRGRVIGVDASEAMIARSRAKLDSKVDLVTSDLLEFEPPEPVDLVFSTAALHWIDDQAACFARFTAGCVPAVGSRLSSAARATCARFSMRS
jgi:trans-aconitate 2-methyltransferase